MSFASAFANSMQIKQQRADFALRQQAAARTQQIEEQKQTGDAIKYFSDVVGRAPDDQVTGITKMFMTQLEQIGGKTIDPSVKSMILQDPSNASKVFMNAYSQANGQVNLKTLSTVLTNPQAYIAIQDAHNQRNNAKEAAVLTSRAYGQVTNTTPDTPVDYSLAGPSEAPTGSTSTTQQITPSATDLNSLQGAKNRIQLGMGYLSAHPNVPGFKENMDVLQKQSQAVDGQIQFALQNPQAFAAAQLGIQIENANPAQLMRIQQQAAVNAGTLKQFETTGAAAGTPATLEELSTAQQQVGGLKGGLPGFPGNTTSGGAPQIAPSTPAGSGSGKPGVPLTEGQKEETKALIGQGIKLREEVHATSEASRTGLTDLAQLKILKPLADTGKLGNLKVKLDAIAEGIFGIKSPNLAPAQVFTMITEGMGLNLVNSLKGAATEKEEAWVRGMQPAITTSPKALDIFIDLKTAIHERNIEKEKMLLQYQRSDVCGLHGQNCKQSFQEMYDVWANKHDMTAKLQAVVDKYVEPTKSPVAPTIKPTIKPTQPTIPTRPNVTAPEFNGGGAAFLPPHGIRPRAQ